MDFAEQVLLSSFLRQPSQIHFVTGLKFDIFGVSCSNLDTNFVFGLPEGKWPGKKRADQSVSMLFHILQLAKSEEKSKNALHLILNADDCSEQNKNLYVFWFAAWLVMAEHYYTIKSCFLHSAKQQLNILSNQ